MVTHKLFDYKGETLTFHQCMTQDEAKENELPEGVYFFWTLGKQKINNPYDIVQLTLKATEEGTLDVQKLVTPENMRQHYKALHEGQMSTIKKALQKTKSYYESAYSQSGIDSKAIAEITKNLNKQINSFDKMGFPGMNGLSRPTRKQAEILLGNKENVDRFMSPEMQRKVFNE